MGALYLFLEIYRMLIISRIEGVCILYAYNNVVTEYKEARPVELGWGDIIAILVEPNISRIITRGKSCNV